MSGRDISSLMEDPGPVLNRLAADAHDEESKALLGALQEAYKQASEDVAALMPRIESAIEHTVAYFKSKHTNFQDYKLYAESLDKTLSHFDKKGDWQLIMPFVAPYYSAWLRAKDQLSSIQAGVGSHVDRYHALRVAFQSDEDLLDAVESMKVSIGDELGFFILSRLKEIQSRHPTLKARANRFLSQLPLEGVDSLFACDVDAARIELVKLRMTALLHPETKGWVGTSMAVDALIQKRKSLPAYFNPDPKRNSWLLNRIWVMGLSVFGLDVELAELQQPAIYKAMSADNPLPLMLALLDRAGTHETPSQYNRGSTATATMQEVLCLMSMHYKWVDGCLTKSSRKSNDLHQLVRASRVRSTSFGGHRAFQLPVQEEFELQKIGGSPLRVDFR